MSKQNKYRYFLRDSHKIRKFSIKLLLLLFYFFLIIKISILECAIVIKILNFFFNVEGIYYYLFINLFFISVFLNDIFFGNILFKKVPNFKEKNQVLLIILIIIVATIIINIIGINRIIVEVIMFFVVFGISKKMKKEFKSDSTIMDKYYNSLSGINNDIYQKVHKLKRIYKVISGFIIYIPLFLSVTYLVYSFNTKTDLFFYISNWKKNTSIIIAIISIIACFVMVYVYNKKLKSLKIICPICSSPISVYEFLNRKHVV